MKKTGLIFKRHSPKPNRSLFHYTTAEGLIGIIEQQTIFATHSEFSNDATECKLILPIIAEAIEPEFRKIVSALIEQKIMSEKFHADHGSTDIYASESLKAANSLLNATNNLAPMYLTSFCIHDVDEYSYRHGLLSQWRGYARGGFAIEFEETKLAELSEWENKTYAYQNFIGNTVEYTNHAAFIGADTFKGLAGAFMRAAMEVKDGEKTEIFGERNANEFVLHFLNKAPLLKHHGFREEREFRIVAPCYRPGLNLDGDTREVKLINFRNRAGSVVPHIRLFDQAEPDLPIKAVVVGPHPKQDDQAKAVELLLKSNEINVEIRISEIPIRD